MWVENRWGIADGWKQIYFEIWPTATEAAPPFKLSMEELLATARNLSPADKHSMLNMASQSGVALSETELDRFHIVQDIVYRHMAYSGGARGAGQEATEDHADLEIFRHPQYSIISANDATYAMQQPPIADNEFDNYLSGSPSIFPSPYEDNSDFPPSSLSDLPSAFLSASGFDNENVTYSASVSLPPFEASSPSPDFTSPYLSNIPSTFSPAPELHFPDSEYDELDG
jgi:hypothetical protein